MAKFQAVWAIDIGQAALKAIKLVPGETPELVVAEAFDFIEYPKILSQPDADPEELVREALLTFLGRNELKGSRVAIAVPGQAGLVKFIKLPPVEKKRIPDIVKFEAKQQIPFALEEVIWDYQQIATGEEGEDADDDFAMVEVGLFAMKRDQIHRAILPLKAAGIEVDIVQMAPIALFNFIAFDRMSGPEKPDGSVVLLDIGADNTDLIITDGARIWQRNVPIGGNHFTRALTKELKLTFAKAEHLKRNATKSQDPRAVFTAMRGVFNDLSSEVSRSIGFYSSVNRQAKVVKIIGLGNGFKLPGLQKFLQQNLNQDVERLEGFQRMVGEEVTSAPQFAENQLSFAVAYGLGLQGLGLAPLKSNLLPPEIEQVRMIRRKKPWALVGAALLMLGFSTLFFGDYTARAKVVNDDMKTAVEGAKRVAQRGSQLKSAFDSAKAAFGSKKAEGEALVAPATGGTEWDELLVRVNSVLPNPSGELGLDPNNPKNAEILSLLRVHIDAILPRYRTDLNTEWFASTTLEAFAKDYMHPYDRATPPSGEGWIIQIIGHHYNPSPLGEAAKKLPEEIRNKYAVGPVAYLTHRVVPRLWTVAMRQFGIHHATLVWVDIDDKWVTAKAAAGNPLPPAPIEPRKAAPATAGGTSSMMAAMMGGKGGETSISSSDYASMTMSGGGSMSGGYESMMQGAMSEMSGGYSSMMSGYSGRGGATTKDQPEETTLTRTNFMIQLLWQPPKPEEAPKTPEEAKTKAEEIAKALTEAAKGEGVIKPIDLKAEADIAAKSQQLQQKKAEEQIKAISKAVDAAKAAAPAGTAAAPGEAGTAPAAPDAATPAAPTTPPATPEPPK